jgi:hypothetical protein
MNPKKGFNEKLGVGEMSDRAKNKYKITHYSNSNSFNYKIKNSINTYLYMDKCSMDEIYIKNSNGTNLSKNQLCILNRFLKSLARKDKYKLRKRVIRISINELIKECFYLPEEEIDTALFDLYQYGILILKKEYSMLYDKINVWDNDNKLAFLISNKIVHMREITFSGENDMCMHFRDIDNE